MTEAELLENAGIYWSNFVTSFGIGITIISGYLIVAYSVGASLTRSQVILVNVMFFGNMAFIVQGLNGFGAAAADLEGAAWAMTTQRTFEPTPWGRWGVMVFVVLCVFGAFKFMIDVRHPKAK
tara:strand:- start:964 stop:1332 length:369 start_codon:yes stop_codon:yes gene_type:complete